MKGEHDMRDMIINTRLLAHEDEKRGKRSGLDDDDDA